MKFVLKIFGLVLLAEILTLFIDLTLAFSGHLLLRLICSICTVSILAGLSAQAGYYTAQTYQKKHESLSKFHLLGFGLLSSLPFLLCWTGLLLAKYNLIYPEFYRIYKLLCAPFLPVCNLFSTDISALTLPVSGLLCLFLLSFIPFFSFSAVCMLTMQK